jgi:hypothetical protein
MKKSFEDTKGVIRRHKSKYRHDNEKIKGQKDNIDLQTLQRKNKNRTTRKQQRKREFC